VRKLYVGDSRKIGFRACGSAEASYNIEVELPSELLRDGAEGLHAQIRGPYSVVDDEPAQSRVTAATTWTTGPCRPTATGTVTGAGAPRPVPDLWTVPSDRSRRPASPPARQPASPPARQPASPPARQP